MIKEPYLAPLCEALPVHSEGPIAKSNPKYNNPFPGGEQSW